VGSQEVIGLVVRDDETLTFVAPPLPRGTHPVELRSPSGQMARLAPGLRYVIERLSFASRHVLAETAPTDSRGGVHDFAVADFTDR
jgi:hypothetical protein